MMKQIGVNWWTRRNHHESAVCCVVFLLPGAGRLGTYALIFPTFYRSVLFEPDTSTFRNFPTMVDWVRDSILLGMCDILTPRFDHSNVPFLRPKCRRLKDRLPISNRCLVGKHINLEQNTRTFTFWSLK